MLLLFIHLISYIIIPHFSTIYTSKNYFNV